MRAATGLAGGLQVRISDERGSGRSAPVTDAAAASAADAAAPAWPTHRLQGGLTLLDGDHDLGEEGLGFGVPVLKRGLQTVFPGSMTLTVAADGPDWRVTAAYRLDLVERLARGGGVFGPRLMYAAKDSLAAVHRRVPALRRPLGAASEVLRRRLGWRTTYEPAGLIATVPVTYTVRGDEGVVSIDADLRGVPAGVTEVVLMNELGAGEFDRYEDSSGVSLGGAAVGSWDEVVAETASFVGTGRAVAFTLAQAPGARLLRGREVAAGRLSWAGFGYSVRPGAPRFSYEVRVERRAGIGAA